jgi:hypothetical protein
LERREKERKLAADAPHAALRDLIGEWENLHEAYAPINIDLAKVKITNYSNKELSVEFFDFLIGNAVTVLKDNDILQNIRRIDVSFVTKKADAVILSVIGEHGEVLKLFFSGDEFKLVHSQETGKNSPKQ